jgi:hypothetical protein
MPIDPELFMEEVAGFYRSLGFDVERRRVTNDGPEHLFIQKRIAGVPTQALVECLNHPESQVAPAARQRILVRLQNLSEKFPSHKPIVLSSERLAPEARLEFETALIGSTAYPDLVREFVPLEDYARRLIARFDDWYIEPDLTVDGELGKRAATAYLNEWLEDSSAGLLLLLGETGMGKSALLRHQAVEMARAFLRDPLHHPAPVLILLGDVRQAISWESILLHHFNDWGFPGLGLPQLDYLARRGRVVFLFDAFDEMPDQVRADLIRNNFRELTRPIENGRKAVFSCRTQYFKDRQERKRLLGPEPDVLDLADLPDLEVIRLREFSDRQVEAYLARAHSSETGQDAMDLDAVYELRDLAHRPVLLQMILRGLRKFASPDDAARLYAGFTDAWLDREDRPGRLLDREVKRSLMCKLAWWLWLVEKETIHYSKLTAFLERWLAEERLPLADQDVPEIAREAASRSFLNRDTDGNYGFIHRSFREYFLACELHGALDRAGHDADGRNRARASLKTRPFPPATIRFLTLLDPSRRIETPLQLFLREPYVSQVSENALHLLYWGTRIRVDLEGGATDSSELRAAMQTVMPARVRLAGADLRQAVFEGIVLPEADFQQADLRGANFEQADLRGSDFRGANLDGGSFRDATLTGCNFDGAIQPPASAKS